MIRSITSKAFKLVNLTLHQPIVYKTATYTTKSIKKMENENKNEKNIIWVDLEMTGLDVEKDKIIEIACLVTDDNLNIVAESPNLVIHHSDETLNSMNEWCIKQFAKSGLTQLSRDSKISIVEAESEMLKFVQKYSSKGICPLAGNSVYMDKMFLSKYMKNFADHLHYRIIDVSSIKELCKRWNPELYKNVPKKQMTHRALDDIRESVEELKFYKTNFFVKL